jgi:pyrimidine operon attenuation protein/uracil phosphoribosyltransferase
MNRTSTVASGKVILDAKGVAEKINQLTKQIADEFFSRRDAVALVGIQTRGVSIARRIAAQLGAQWKQEIPVGVLDITLYRDDVHAIGDQPEVKETDIPFDMEDRPVILIDDVLFTGRTIRSAMNALIDYTRPECIRLAVLVDRGHRELPIGADYVGLVLETQKEDVVDVNFTENDEEDSVRLRKRNKSESSI